MNKSNWIKTALLTCTILVLSIGFMPQAAEARPGDITVYCDGTDNLCATVETSDVIIEVWFGNWEIIIIEL